ncbi:helix-turn-helix domain-containing protein [Ancylobacter polymorphus]|uniref:Helix-turn-helix domain-containing protein n=1 Tax=Ancylobacter polymorphus TaxID=223390 RepID=A0ABU0BHJ0_9HYPH|nr:helix-turn-helix domain-containing protein [Ancylobacter polymorphus]MDQ0305312.1 hypothetical protein [Ancylobacter polymorphus]
MSWQALNWAGDLTLGSPTAKTLLILLANFADEEGECFPSHEKLQKMSEFSARAVQINMNKLEEWGLIERKRDRNDDGTLGRTRYRLCLHIKQKHIDGIHRHDVPVVKNDEPPAPAALEPPARGAGQDNLQEDNHQKTPIAPKGAVGAETSKGWEKDPAYLAFLAEYGPSQAWPKHRGYRQWLKLTEDERKAAVAAIPAYRAVCAKERRKMTDPSAYLRGTFKNFSIRLAPRAPDSDAVQALRRALGANFSGGVMVEHGTPQWAAWQAVAEEAQLPLRAIGYPARPFAGRPEAVTGRYMPSEWPPSRDGPDRQQQAAGG